VVAEADKMIAFFERGGMLFMRTDALYYKGRALLTQGRREEAHQALAQARATAGALGARRILWQVLLALGQIEGSLGNIAEADRLRAEAREIIDYIAGHMGSSELRTAFLNLPDVRSMIGGT
jgi:dTDP-4-amino-4,6-dideoxygalactose transaminase